MPPYWSSNDGRFQIFHANSLELLDQLRGLDIAAVVTDPPYGINYEASRYRMATFAGVIKGDSQEFDPAPWLEFGVPTIMWGGNNFAHRLPPGGWLCWDKRCNERADKLLGSPFELAWCSIRSKFKMIRCQHGGVVNADGHGLKRVHPTQKPIRVMEWCLSDVLRLKADALVLDPYCGSGTTGVACVRTAMQFIGVEIEEKFAAVAAQRIERELATPPLFSSI